MKKVIIIGALVLISLVVITLAVQDQIADMESASKKRAAIEEQDQREWKARGNDFTFELMDDSSSQTLMSIARPAMTITIHGNVPGGEPLAVIYPNGRVELNANGDINEAATRFWQAVSLTMPECYKEGASWESNATAPADR